MLFFFSPPAIIDRYSLIVFTFPSNFGMQGGSKKKTE